MTKKAIAAMAAAAALVLQPAVAAAQASCVSEQELSAMAVYAMPSLLRSVQQRCAGQLQQSGFLAREGRALSARYTALQPRVWPRAKAGLLKIASDRSGLQGAESLAMFTSLPDESVRPLVDALIVQELTPEIPLDHCSRIERGVSAMAPIEPEVAGNLVAVMLSMVADDGLPQVCRLP